MYNRGEVTLVCDGHVVRAGSVTLTRGAANGLGITLKGIDGAGLDISNIESWDIGITEDFLGRTPVLATSASVAVSGSKLDAALNMNTAELSGVIDGKAAIQCFATVRGRDQLGKVAALYVFPVRVLNVGYTDGEIAASLELAFQYSVDKTAWTGVYSEDVAYMRMTLGGGAWTPAMRIKGAQGVPGPANSLEVGSCTAGEFANAWITGEPPNQLIHFVVPIGPQGNPGPASNLEIGSVQGGDEAQAWVSGSPPNQFLHLVLPRGEKGAKGDNAPSLIAQYSLDMQEWKWDYNIGDPYARWSRDGGTTWDAAIRIMGAQGIPGVSIVWLGRLASAPADPALNNAYYNTVDRTTYVFDGEQWRVSSIDATLTFQYSNDGVAWRDEYATGDPYTRYSTDRGATWSSAMVFKGDKGNDAPLPKYQYSFDTASWHDGFLENDFWTRISTDDGKTWGDPARIRGEGIRVAQCTDKGIVYGEESIILNWGDPPDVELNGAVLSRWNKSVLVRKQGGYPGSPADGVVVATTDRALGTKSHYRDNPFVDTGIEAGEEYFYKLFSQTEAGFWNNLDGNMYGSATGWSWSLLRAFVRAKNWDALPPIGTVFGVPHTEFGTIYVRFSGRNTHTPTDRQYTEMMLLECVDILFTAMFDEGEATYGLTFDTKAGAKGYFVLVGGSYIQMEAGVDYQIGGDTAIHDGVTYPIAQWYEQNVTGRGNGNNRYSQSNMDQGLNADYEINAYTFVKRNPWDALAASWMRDGLLRHIDTDFKSCLLPVDIVTALANIDGGGNETISRRVFLPSTTELYGTGTQGRQYDWYVGTVNADKIKLLNGVATNWWQRSPYVTSASNAYYVSASGASASNSAVRVYGVSPAFALG